MSNICPRHDRITKIDFGVTYLNSFFLPLKKLFKILITFQLKYQLDSHRKKRKALFIL